MTCVSVKRRDAAKPARSDELRYLISNKQIERNFLLVIIALRTASIAVDEMRILTFLNQMSILIEILVPLKIRFAFSFFSSTALNHLDLVSHCPMAVLDFRVHLLR